MSWSVFPFLSLRFLKVCLAASLPPSRWEAPQGRMRVFPSLFVHRDSLSSAHSFSGSATPLSSSSSPGQRGNPPHGLVKVTKNNTHEWVSITNMTLRLHIENFENVSVADYEMATDTSHLGVWASWPLLPLRSRFPSSWSGLGSVTCFDTFTGKCDTSRGLKSTCTMELANSCCPWSSRPLWK